MSIPAAFSPLWLVKVRCDSFLIQLEKSLAPFTMDAWDWQHNHPLVSRTLLALRFWFHQLCCLSVRSNVQPLHCSSLPGQCDAGRGFCLIYTVLEPEPDLILVLLS